MSKRNSQKNDLWRKRCCVMKWYKKNNKKENRGGRVKRMLPPLTHTSGKFNEWIKIIILEGGEKRKKIFWPKKCIWKIFTLSSSHQNLKIFYFVFFPSKLLFFLKQTNYIVCFSSWKRQLFYVSSFAKTKVYQALFFPKKDKVTWEKPN